MEEEVAQKFEQSSSALNFTDIFQLPKVREKILRKKFILFY
jgi:hypothetical protein